MKDSLIKAYVLVRVGINQATTPGPRDEQRGRHGDTRDGRAGEGRREEETGRGVKCV